MLNKFFGYFSSISNSNFKEKKKVLKVAFNVNSECYCCIRGYVCVMGFPEILSDMNASCDAKCG